MARLEAAAAARKRAALQLGAFGYVVDAVLLAEQAFALASTSAVDALAMGSDYAGRFVARRGPSATVLHGQLLAILVLLVAAG